MRSGEGGADKEGRIQSHPIDKLHMDNRLTDQGVAEVRHRPFPKAHASLKGTFSFYSERAPRTVLEVYEASFNDIYSLICMRGLALSNTFREFFEELRPQQIRRGLKVNKFKFSPCSANGLQYYLRY